MTIHALESALAAKTVDVGPDHGHAGGIAAVLQAVEAGLWLSLALGASTSRWCFTNFPAVEVLTPLR